jgi:hypothetical protein
MRQHRLIELSIPLDAISAQSVREKSIHHGHISALHTWQMNPGESLAAVCHGAHSGADAPTP